MVWILGTTVFLYFIAETAYNIDKRELFTLRLYFAGLKFTSRNLYEIVLHMSIITFLAWIEPTIGSTFERVSEYAWPDFHGQRTVFEICYWASFALLVLSILVVSAEAKLSLAPYQSYAATWGSGALGLVALAGGWWVYRSAARRSRRVWITGLLTFALLGAVAISAHYGVDVGGWRAVALSWGVLMIGLLAILVRAITWLFHVAPHRHPAHFLGHHAANGSDAAGVRGLGNIG